ncbi:hypothetical protein NDU88_009642 [Pleurodeles waltl]|uniref:Uncharacterized protein n=1 Tax=Pleurodeles waltl TaxID=8319 RepID=A0AAV7QTD7_PLEWA|nr:hypothetical protein NDU88_009642 [Pleurodeles waltl]
MECCPRGEQLKSSAAVEDGACNSQALGSLRKGTGTRSERMVLGPSILLFIFGVLLNGVTAEKRQPGSPVQRSARPK